MPIDGRLADTLAGRDAMNYCTCNYNNSLNGKTIWIENDGLQNGKNVKCAWQLKLVMFWNETIL